MKTVYVVRGSEDGTLGVYTNIKKAYEMACKYLHEFSDQMTVSVWNKDKTGLVDRKGSYSNVTKDMKQNSSVFIYANWLTVEISEFILNHL